MAIMADIKAMFHRVSVAEEHRDYLRFLWWPQGNLEQGLGEHRMTVHLFGAFHHPVSLVLLLEMMLKTIRLTFQQK